MFDEVMTQDTNAADDGFVAGLGDEFAEDMAEQQDTNAAEPQEEESEQQNTAEDTNEAGAEQQEEATKEETPKEEEQPAEAVSDGVEVMFLGEKRKLSRDETVTYAQKGLNYDRVMQQLNDERASKAQLEAELTLSRASNTLFPLLKAYAQASGGTLEDLTQNMTEAVRAAGISIEKPAESNYMREKAVKQWQDFMQAYPDIKDPKNELPQEVWNAIKDGMSPRTALVEYKQKDFEGKMAQKDGAIAEKDQKIAALEQEIKTLKLNAENKRKAVGSLNSTAPAEERTGFLGGLFM
jgi:hypothetical protein